MKTIICDDHRLFSGALASFLVGNGIEVVACPTDPAHAVAQVTLHDIDVCLLDVTFGDQNSGIEAIRSVHHASPTTRVVVLTGSTDPHVILDAIEAGADKIAFKGDDIEEIIAAIHSAARPESRPGHGVAPAAKESPGARPVVSARATDELGRFLTDREFEVLELLVAGHSAKRIARDLDIAYSTARTHVQNVLVKLGVHSRLEAVAVAVERGLRTPEDRRTGRTRWESPP